MSTTTSNEETTLFSSHIPLHTPKPHVPMIFLNLPVSSISASHSFYEALGFVANPHFNDGTSGMLSLPPLFPSSAEPDTPANNLIGTINLMVMTAERFQGFLPAGRVPAAGVRQRTELQALFSIGCETAAEVDGWVERAVRAGGKADVCPWQDVKDPDGEEVLMRGRSFEDLDGHVWEVVWMHPKFAAGTARGGAEGCNLKKSED